MNNPPKLAIADRIFNTISSYSQQRFTGKIEIDINFEKKISVYLHLGHIAWVSDGAKSYQRFIRLLQKLGLSLETAKGILYVNQQTNSSSPTEENTLIHEEYDTLVLIAKNNFLSKGQVQALISHLAQEILFDFINDAQPQNLPNHQNNVHLYPVEGVRPSASSFMPYSWLCPLNAILPKARKTYEQWLGLGLGNYSPNFVLVITNHQSLSQRTSKSTYKNLVNLLNGKKTLREIAVEMELGLIKVVKPLCPLIKEGVISLYPSSPTISEKTIPQLAPKKLKVVAVDDSPQTLRILKEIITRQGHEFIGISNPVAALSTVIEQAPDVIFLDLMMPIINGYELCSKMRQVESIADLPIIFLTSNLIDQFRAKLAGASQCLEKPILTQKVKEILSTYQKNKEEPIAELDFSSDYSYSNPQLKAVG